MVKLYFTMDNFIWVFCYIGINIGLAKMFIWVFCNVFFFYLNKKFYWRKIEPPRTQGKEHKNSTDTV